MRDKDVDKLLLKYNKVLEELRKMFYLQQQNLELDEGNTITYNPIEYEKSRVKSQDSIKDKLYYKKNLDFTVQNIEKNLEDIAGYRIVCPFLSDIPKIINYINNSGLKILKTKDYIKNPKKSCYKGYHMIVEVPVEIDGVTENVKVEIQIRTMAQNVIASIDHKIRYKNDNYIKDFFEYFFKTYQETEQRLKRIFNYINILDIDLDKFIQERTNQPRKETNPKQLSSSCSKQELDELKKLYEFGLNNLESLINLVKYEYIEQGLINPIEHIKTRIKPTDSIISKLEEIKQEPTIDNIKKYINDMGAMKIVCSFWDDAEEIINKINELEELNEIIILERQDYISSPKESGYSSYHFVVAVPVELNNQIINTKIEIQIKTLAMDFWAALEHILCYKKEVDITTKEKMKEIAADLRMIDIEINKVARVFNKKYNPNKEQKDISESFKILVRTKEDITNS